LNQRVHVLRTPLSDYLRFECEWGYAYNALHKRRKSPVLLAGEAGPGTQGTAQGVAVAVTVTQVVTVGSGLGLVAVLAGAVLAGQDTGSAVGR